MIPNASFDLAPRRRLGRPLDIGARLAVRLEGDKDHIARRAANDRIPCGDPGTVRWSGGASIARGFPMRGDGDTMECTGKGCMTIDPKQNSRVGG